jgi:hypothetical protein
MTLKRKYLPRPLSRLTTGVVAAVGAAVVTLLVYAVFGRFGGWLFPTGSQVDDPDAPVSAGACLSTYPLVLMSHVPSDLPSAVVDCSSETAVSLIIGVQPGGDREAICDGSVGCMSFESGGYRYFLNAIPRPGLCFYGYLNSATPEDAGENRYGVHTGWLGRCAHPYPTAEIPTDGFTSLRGADPAALVPVAFRVSSVIASDERELRSCGAEFSSWPRTYSAESGEVVICARQLPNWLYGVEVGRCTPLTIYELIDDRRRPENWASTMDSCDDAYATAEITGIAPVTPDEPEYDESTEVLLEIDGVLLTATERPRAGLCYPGARIGDRRFGWFYRLIPCTISDAELSEWWTEERKQSAAKSWDIATGELRPAVIEIKTVGVEAQTCEGPAFAHVRARKGAEEMHYCLQPIRELEPGD